MQYPYGTATALKKPQKKALYTFAKVGGTVALGAFLGAQLARKGAIEFLLGEKTCQKIAEKIAGQVLNGDEAIRFIAKNLAKAVPIIISVITIVGPEAIDFAKNRISPQQLFKNLAVAGAGAGGALIGNRAGIWAAGKLGAILGVNLGPVGGFVGVIAGALLGAWGAKYLLDLIIDDDDKEMVRIISFEMEIFMGDFLWSFDEAEKANKKLHDNLKDGDKLKIMFASEDRYLAAQNVIIPVLEEIVANRPKNQLPKEDEDLLKHIGEIIEDSEEAPTQIQENKQNSEKEITLSKMYYGDDDSKKWEAINLMFTFLRLLIKDKCPDANERILVPSAQFGKEIPAYFDEKINLCDELKIKESKFFEKALSSALDELANSEKLTRLKKEGTLWEFSECVYEILNEKMSNENEIIIPEVVDEKYSENYSEDSFWDKITSTVKKAGSKLIYQALQLFYAMQNPDCPIAIKGAIIAALGYFILPIDLVPDFLPIVGFADDLTAIGAAITMAHMYIDDNVIQKAKNKMCELFSDDILKELN